MFHRFSNSARSCVFRAVELASLEGGNCIEPKHLLIALIQLRPVLFEKASQQSIAAPAIQAELAQLKTDTHAPTRGDKLQFSEGFKRVLMRANEQARSCWNEWEAPRRKRNQVLPEDLEYWEARTRQSLRNPRFSGGFASWLLRRTWEVDERHLLLGLIGSPECPEIALLANHDVTLDGARQRLCAKER